MSRHNAEVTMPTCKLCGYVATNDEVVIGGRIPEILDHLRIEHPQAWIELEDALRKKLPGGGLKK